MLLNIGFDWRMLNFLCIHACIYTHKCICMNVFAHPYTQLHSIQLSHACACTCVSACMASEIHEYSCTCLMQECVCVCMNMFPHKKKRNSYVYACSRVHLHAWCDCVCMCISTSYSRGVHACIEMHEYVCVEMHEYVCMHWNAWVCMWHTHSQVHLFVHTQAAWAVMRFSYTPLAHTHTVAQTPMQPCKEKETPRQKNRVGLGVNNDQRRN